MKYTRELKLPRPRSSSCTPYFALTVIVTGVIIGGALFVALALSPIFLWPTEQSPDQFPLMQSDGIEDWETYNNVMLQIAFQYPAHFTVVESQAYSNGGLQVMDITVMWEGEEGLFYRWLRVREVTVQDSEPYLNLEVGESFTSEVGITGFNQVTTRLPDHNVGGSHAYVFETPAVWEVEGPLRSVLVPRNGRNLQIDMTYSIKEDRNIDYPRIFDQILSSFRFTS